MHTIRNSAGDEAGFAIIEIVVAAALFLIMAGAALTTLTQTELSTTGAERHAAAVALGQGEAERMRQADWSSLGIGAAPTPAAASSGANPSNPNEYVSGTKLLVRSNFRNRSSAPPPGVDAAGEPMVVVTGAPAPGPERVDAGGWMFDVYRYVTWVDLRCMVGGTDKCPSTQDAKRIVIAIRPAAEQGAAPGLSKPVWISSVVTNPAAVSPGATPPPAPADPTSTAQGFYLYDTTCDKAAREAVVAGHAAHDTGQGLDCASSTAPRPDLMGTVAAPSPPVGTVPPDPPNYGQDYPVARTGDLAAPGLALMPPEASGVDCPISYASATAAADTHRVHRWASTSMASTFTSTARSSMALWTKTVGETAGEATICVHLHRLSNTNQVLTPAGAACATPSTCALAAASYRIAAWPQQATQIAFTFEHPQFTLTAGQRVLLTLSLTKSSLPGGIELLYDHPIYDSVLSVGTTTPLP